MLGGLSSFVSDWVFSVLALLGVGGGGAAGYLRSVKKNTENIREIAEENQRRLEGDPENPNDEGLMDIAYDTRTELHEFRDEAQENHRQVITAIQRESDEDDLGFGADD